MATFFFATARATTVEADGTVAPEWSGMHASLTAIGVVSVAGAVVRVLAFVSITEYLRVSKEVWGKMGGWWVGRGVGLRWSWDKVGVRGEEGGRRAGGGGLPTYPRFT